MNIARNYQKELDKIIEDLSVRRAASVCEETAIQPPKLLLHACCAPCSSYCLEYLRTYFDLTVFYYNPNITEAAEYRKRVAEERRLIEMMNFQACAISGQRAEEELSGQSGESADGKVEEFARHRKNPSGSGKIKLIEGDYNPSSFYEIAKGLERCPEGGERCFRCYELRLRESAKVAGELQFDYFTTTLTISPLKNAAKLNGIGERLGEEYGVAYLPSDFKKRNGYKRSIELSKEYHLYRQDYCGCVYSRMEREKQKQARQESSLER